MEKNQKLLKDAKPGEMSIRGSISKPDLISPPAHTPTPPKTSPSEPSDAPVRRPFEDAPDA